MIKKNIDKCQRLKKYLNIALLIMDSLLSKTQIKMTQNLSIETTSRKNECNNWHRRSNW